VDALNKKIFPYLGLLLSNIAILKGWDEFEI